MPRIIDGSLDAERGNQVDRIFPSMVVGTVNMVALVLPLAVLAAVGLVYLRARRRLFLGDSSRERQGIERRVPDQASYGERPLPDVERTLERLIAEGRIELERAMAEDSSRASLPPRAGEVLRRYLTEYRMVRLVDADLSLDFRHLSTMTDSIGGWRLGASDESVDVRIGCGSDGEAVLDATWSPTQGGEVMRHSTIAHFIVRAAAGDRE